MNILRLILFFSFYLLLTNCKDQKVRYETQITEVLKDSVLVRANEFLKSTPVTITSFTSPRSSGGVHDFFSEGDYWWPDTLNLEGPYIQKDGLSNPDNFTEHREVLIDLSEIVGNLTSAYLITKDTTYANAAIKHCKAWFIDDSTKMNPHFLYAQAIKGRHTGRGVGIIDGIHFMEVVQSLSVMGQEGLIDKNSEIEFKNWFSDFVVWLTTHKYGKDEMKHPNNHGTCWNMQLALYADYTNNDSILAVCRDNFKNTILPNQMALDGSFPLELKRTKPYGYSLFNLDAMVMNCVILSDKTNNLWEYSTPDGKSISLALEFMSPYIENKSTWFKEPDVMYWENWPVAHPSSLFGAIIFDRPDYFEQWKTNKHNPDVFEVKRNLPVRNPLIWLDRLEVGK
tara:strand:+ start:13538 stop:14728 length:1191 start_codon:yes stop_codon:yes gene_type:complete